jgi:hypothetical protein
LINGVTAHVLDYDDVGLDGHPSAVLVPAIFAQGEVSGASGAPHTLSADESNGGPSTITFQRVIVMPDGHKYIEGVTPKALPAPDGSSKDSSE